MFQEKGPVGQNYRGLRDKSGVLTEKGRVNSIIINKILITIIIIITRKTNYHPWIGRWLCGFSKIANWSYCWGIRHSPPLFLPWPASPAPPKNNPWVSSLLSPPRQVYRPLSFNWLHQSSFHKQKQVFHRQLYKQVPTDKLTAKKTDSRSYQPREAAHKWLHEWRTTCPSVIRQLANRDERRAESTTIWIYAAADKYGQKVTARMGASCSIWTTGPPLRSDQHQMAIQVGYEDAT